MKSGEIISITLLVIAGFCMANFLVEHLYLQSVYLRFLLRIGFQVQFLVLIYLFFESRDNSQRLKKLEKHFVAEQRTNDEECTVLKKNNYHSER